MIVNPASSRLRARTVAIPDPGPLETYLPRERASAFIRRGDGVIGLGEIARFETDSLDAADIWWAEFSATIEHETELWLDGTGPLAFGSFAFDPDHSAEPSVLVVPEVIIGRRDGLSWCTQLGHDRLPEQVPSRQPAPLGPGEISWADGSMSGVAWEAMISEAIGLLTTGELDKVVLARDLIANATEPIDPRWLVERLTASYPSTWTFLVDGLIGATPEMLVRRRGGLVTSRVLAGTLQRSNPDEDASRLAKALTSSSKNLREHEFAVTSVAEALAPFCSAMNVPESPSVLELPNVLHLATDITGATLPGATSLALAAAVHPSAAVCGTPTHVARDLICELENLDRGRYAGPVGWIDSSGDGEWALALRSGQLNRTNDRELHLFAGAGIVADSDPAEELNETVAKFRPMRDALG